MLSLLAPRAVFSFSRQFGGGLTPIFANFVQRVRASVIFLPILRYKMSDPFWSIGGQHALKKMQVGETGEVTGSKKVRSTYSAAEKAEDVSTA